MYLSQAIVLLALLAAVMSLLEPVVKRGGSGGGFFSTCERIQVSGRSLLLAECKKTNREKNWSLLDLNHCLLNTGDALIAQREPQRAIVRNGIDGAFGGSNCKVDPEKRNILRCACSTDELAHLAAREVNLDDVVPNHDGIMSCYEYRAEDWGKLFGNPVAITQALISTSRTPKGLIKQ